MAVNQLTVFNIDFDSIADFLQTIGYKSKITQKTIMQRYGSFESFIKRRYKIDNDEQARAKLLELMGQKDDKTVQNVPILETKEQKCAKAYINALINQGNEQILDALCLAFDCKKDDVLQAVESLKNAQ